MSHSQGSSLTETLVLALTQCQEQLRVIQQHSSRVHRLQQENERLKKELQDYRDTVTKNAQENAGQTQELFQKYAEAQAEIQGLQSKLKSYKAKTRKTLASSSSPVVSTPATPVPSSPTRSSAKSRNLGTLLSTTRTDDGTNQSVEGVTHQQNSRAVSSSPPRKRARPNDETTAALQEVLPNLVPTKASSTNVAKDSSTERKLAAIHHLAEDGEDVAMAGKVDDTIAPMVDQNNPVYHRLDGLLAGSTTNKNRLARPASRSPRTVNSLSTPQIRAPPGISNISHSASENKRSVECLPVGAESNTRAEHVKQTISSSSPQTFQDYNPSTIKNWTNTSRRREPLRMRPITELHLSSFKPNPRWLSSHNVSYDDFLNDRQCERMRVLATTLPYLPGESHGHRFTDHELLVDFLGPGSEDRIANLTPVARQNLLLEARTKRVANEFRLSKQTAAFEDKQDDPPGFWSTDMPGTQEAEENKLASKQKEREEVNRRFEDAMSGQGRWVFADEG